MFWELSIDMSSLLAPDYTGIRREITEDEEGRVKMRPSIPQESTYSETIKRSDGKWERLHATIAFHLLLKYRHVDWVLRSDNSPDREKKALWEPTALQGWNTLGLTCFGGLEGTVWAGCGKVRLHKRRSFMRQFGKGQDPAEQTWETWASLRQQQQHRHWPQAV